MADERDPNVENDEIGNTIEEDVVDSADDEFEEVDDADGSDDAGEDIET